MCMIYIYIYILVSIEVQMTLPDMIKVTMHNNMGIRRDAQSKDFRVTYSIGTKQKEAIRN